MDNDLVLKKESPERDRGRERERSRRGDRPSRFSSNTRDRSPVRERRDRKSGDRRVYVSNVAYESKWQDIKDLFRQEVGEVTYVELFTDENDKPRGCGVVEFDTPELAARAIERMHRFDLKGRKLVVKEESEFDRDKHGRLMGGRSERSDSGRANSRRDDPPRSNTWDGNNKLSTMNSNPPSAGLGGSANSSKFGNTYGLSTSFLETLGINGPLVSKVFVANLDYKVDEKKLREVFRLAGKVMHAELSIDKEGKSRGFGVVEYDHPVEAVQAISILHNQMLYDRRLAVRMDRADKTDGPPKLPDGLKSIGMGLGVNGTILNDVARNLPGSNIQGTSPSAPMNIAPNVQQLQAAAAAAQAQAQLAQGAQLAAHLSGSNTLAPNLSNVAGLLGQSINVSDLALTSNHALNPGLGPGLAGLNAGIASGLNPSFNINQNSMVGGNSNSFSNAGSGLHSPISGFVQSRDFDSMSAALSGSNSGGYGAFDRDNFRGGNNMRDVNYNGSTRGVGNGRNMGNNPPTVAASSNSRRSDAVIVKNLPPGASYQHLVEKFRDIGEVVAVEQGKDAALLRYRSDWDAERAVRELDRSRFEGRTIDVMLYYN